MKARLFAAGISLAAVLSTPVSAMTGMEFYNRCGHDMHGERCGAFVVGVAAGLRNTQQICVRGFLDEEQMILIVQRYMHDHPEELGAAPGALATHAFLQAYPCR